MLAIQRDDITKVEGGFRFNCVGCNKEHTVTKKASAIRTIERGKCISCAVHYRRLQDADTCESLGVYLNQDKKWCSTCSGCGKEQAYTRKDHARQSAKADWKCKNCAQFENKTRPSVYQGFRLMDFDIFKNTAKGRSLSWDLEIEDIIAMWNAQNGCCALSGIRMEKNPKTWSLDRIDNDKGYEKDNVHLVLKKLNMMRGKYSVTEFIELAKAVARHNS